MRTVLFIAYLFPPIANSGTRRSLSFANHLPDHGWQPLVLTQVEPPPHLCDRALMSEVRAGTRIERAPLLGSNIARRLAGALAAGERRERIAAGLEWRLNNLVQVPDEVLSWYPEAVERGVALHRETGFDAIYASGWPWSAFLVASAIGRRTGCPYILDYRDTWTPRGTAKWEKPSRAQAAFSPRLQRWAAKEAAALITVTPSLVPVVKEDTGRNHVHCITNGFEPADFTRTTPAPVKSDAICIAYTGIWRPDYGLHGLYQAIRKLKDDGHPGLHRLKVRAAGFKPGPAREMGIDDVVEETGYVPHEVATQMMNDADLLYLSVPEGFYANACLPGKLFEYMGSANPILAVVPAGSEVAQVLDEVGGGVRVDPGDNAAIGRVVQRLLAGERDGLFTARNAERLQRYTRAATTAELARVLDAACAGAPRELAS
ncbi:MAG: glycosyltransferase [Pseudomonadota bacterium]